MPQCIPITIPPDAISLVLFFLFLCTTIFLWFHICDLFGPLECAWRINWLIIYIIYLHIDMLDSAD